MKHKEDFMSRARIPIQPLGCRRVRLSALVLSWAMLSSTALMAPAAAAEGYHVVQTFAVGGDGGWDYLVVDPAARRLYVTRGSRVMVLDADSGKSVGEIPGNGLHGVALVPELGKGFSSNGRSASVTVFEMGSLK